MTRGIDFLPASYHRDRARRRNRVWQRTLMGVSGGLVILGTLQLWKMERQLEANRDRLLAEAQKLASQLADPAELQERVRRLDVAAELVTRLQLGASPSRVLQAVSQSLPEFVSLTEYRTQYETLVKSKRSKPSVEAEKELSPVEEDLQSLVRMSEERALVITVQGLAPHDIAISTFLAHLQDTRMFEQVTLLYTDERPYGEFSLRTFGIRLHVRGPLTASPDEGVAEGTLAASHASPRGALP